MQIRLPMNLRFGLRTWLCWFLGLPLAVGLVFEIQLFGQELFYGIFGYLWISDVCRKVFEVSHVLESFSINYLSFVLTTLPGWMILTILSCVLGYSKVKYRRMFGPIIAAAVLVSAASEDLASGGLQFLLMFNLRIISLFGCALVFGGWLIGRRLSKTNVPETEDSRHSPNLRQLLVDAIAFLALLFLSGRGWSSFQSLANMDG